MATAATTAKEVDKKVELMKEVRAHEVAIGELNNLPPSRAVYQKACNIFFRKSVKLAVTSEQSMVLIALHHFVASNLIWRKLGYRSWIRPEGSQQPLASATLSIMRIPIEKCHIIALYKFAHDFYSPCVTLCAFVLDDNMAC